MLWCGVNQVAKLERTLATIERLQAPVALASGLGLAIVYVVWQCFINRWVASIAATTCLVPFAVGGAAAYFGFAVWSTRVDRARRQLLALDPVVPCELPAARVVVSGAAPQAAPVAPAPLPARQPDLPPADPAQGPRLLK